MEKLLTKSESTAQKIKERILEGKYPIKGSLPQRKLAQEFGVSPIVVRESLRQLEKEGLVEIVPKWGARVISFHVEKIWGISIVREALEGMAARLLAERITKEEYAFLHKFAQRVDNLFDNTDVSRREVAKVHYSFHLKIAEFARCLELYRSLKQVNVQFLLYLNSEVVDRGILTRRKVRHMELVEVIAKGDPGKAEEAMRFHVRKGYKDILDFRREDTEIQNS